ncbi:hypothetical protein D3X11_00700 [Streptococcus sp. X16XC17]|uniref:hypothetical protein n=1 Tax=unclassified Streptococcus TaxID=2608887 RepID=UPI00066FD460|nr:MULTISPECIES: hypothetical protein [unclassified Streptococcus]TCD46034.1 hypothetical protein D3X11_00700 [Streptococcus sp. X16XC17]
MDRQTKFPLVADNGLMLGSNPHMHLYEESDLISNIKGPYQEKDYGMAPASQPEVCHELEELVQPMVQPVTKSYSRKERLDSRQHSSHRVSRHLSQPFAHATEKTQGQLAREQAREDLKHKRAASYLTDDKPSPAKILKQKETSTSPIQEKATHLSQLANRLRQEHYILADMPMVYSLEKEDREDMQQHRPRNSYDFLKKSQVYDYPERKMERERQMAQELNLTHMGEDMS